MVAMVRMENGIRSRMESSAGVYSGKSGGESMKRPQKLAVMLVPTPPYEICGLAALGGFGHHPVLSRVPGEGDYSGERRRELSFERKSSHNVLVMKALHIKWRGAFATFFPKIEKTIVYVSQIL